MVSKKPESEDIPKDARTELIKKRKEWLEQND